MGRLAVDLIRFMVFAGLLFFPGFNELAAQGGNRLRADALDALEKKDYESALDNYNSLVNLYPADPLYKYFSGLCLVELERSPDDAVKMLSDAIKGSSAMRPVPPDAWLYLGRAYQQAGKFTSAIEQFDLYGEKVKRKVYRESGAETYMLQCREGKGSIEGTSTPVNTADDEEEEMVREANEGQIMQADTIPVMTREEEEPVRTDTVTNAVDSRYDMIAKEALEWQYRADSVSKIAERYRNNMRSLSGSDRETVSRKIVELEGLVFDYQGRADRKFEQAARLSATIIGEGDDLPVIPINEEKQVPDEAGVQNADTTMPGETVIVPADTLIEEIPEPEPVLEIFSDNYTEQETIEVNPDVPEGLYYRIQTAAFRNPVDQKYFKKLGPVTGFKADNSEITFYFIGEFRKLADASIALAKVREKGFRDAFIVPVADGKKVSMERASIMEKEWAGVTLVKGGVPKQAVARKAEPAEPPTLMYRVEVARSKKPLPDEELEKFRRVAGNRKFDVLLSTDEQYVYLIGNFITFESADSYSDLIFRNGVKDAKVVAYLGDREIPLEKAKELFEMYFNK